MAVVATVGLVLRVWPVGRLGLTHFDEGIYALAGSWAFAPKGLAAIDPILIAYAPPGFPILIGLMYAIFGPSDAAAIAVSQVAGTLTIPVVAWLARRTFGPGTGLAAATLVALSGPHIAFSRMAMTDASFLLAWLVALGAGMRFLERPGPRRALPFGLAVGLAQQFKYNGWLAGGIVIVAAALAAIARPEDRRPGWLLRTFGWGGIAALVAALVVLPWYLFVEAHGGYPALLRHQRSYLGGPGRWLSSFRTQAAQTVALSGSQDLVLAAFGVAILGSALTKWSWGLRVRTGWLDRFVLLALIVAGAIFVAVIPNAAWWIGLASAPWLLTGRRTSARVVGAWWLILSAITPFYHPYARLWLPIHAAGWIILGGILGNGVESAAPYLRRLRGRATPDDPSFLRFALIWGWFLAVGTIASVEMEALDDRIRIMPGLFDPSDSLRQAASRVKSIVPEEVAALRYYGRPCLTYYLAGRLALLPQPGPETVLQPGDRRIWALLDQGVGGGPYWPTGIERWEPIESIPTTLALPTMLDLDPGVAMGRNLFIARSAPLTLLRPRRPGDSR